MMRREWRRKEAMGKSVIVILRCSRAESRRVSAQSPALSAPTSTVGILCAQHLLRLCFSTRIVLYFAIASSPYATVTSIIAGHGLSHRLRGRAATRSEQIELHALEATRVKTRNEIVALSIQNSPIRDRQYDGLKTDMSSGIYRS